MSNKEIIELLEEYKRVLILCATGGTVADNEFSDIRQSLITNPQLKDKLPPFVKVYRTPYEFFKYTQSMYSHYAERRQFIAEEINLIIAYFEEENGDVFTALDDFSKDDIIDSGGYGVVYSYHHSVLDMDFAVKLFDPVFADAQAQSEGEKRFFREAKLLFSLHHDNIVQIYNAGYVEGQAFILMELVRGYNLIKLREKYPLVFRQTLKPMIQILSGLGYAHNKGILHRDLKPTNVMFSEPDKLFKIIDFGVSAYIEHESHTKLTKTGEQVTGGLYIDPQLQSNPKLRDVRSDIYSVGAIWYFLLTGFAPSGYDMKDKLLKTSGITEDEVEIVMKCLAADLDDRYSSCEELIEIIKQKRTYYTK